MTERSRNMFTVCCLLLHLIIVKLLVYAYIYIYIQSIDPIFSPYAIITSVMKYIVGRDSSVGIATRYGLEGAGARFSAPGQTVSRAHPPKRNRVFAGGKATEACHRG
jgi:hypothetical protein